MPYLFADPQTGEHKAKYPDDGESDDVKQSQRQVPDHHGVTARYGYPDDERGYHHYHRGDPEYGLFRIVGDDVLFDDEFHRVGNRLHEPEQAGPRRPVAQLQPAQSLAPPARSTTEQ